MGCKCTKTCVSSEFLTPSGSRAWPNGRLYIHTRRETFLCRWHPKNYHLNTQFVLYGLCHPDRAVTSCCIWYVLYNTCRMPSSTHNYSHLLHLQERDTLFFPASNAWRHCFLPSTQHLEAPLRFGLGETELEQRRRTEGIRTFSLALAMVEIDEPGCPRDLLTLSACMRGGFAESGRFAVPSLLSIRTSFSPTILVCVQCESGNCTVRCAQLNPAACLFVVDFLSSLEHNDCTAPPVPCVAVAVELASWHARLVSSILTKPLRIDRVAIIFGIRLWARIQKLPQDTVHTDLDVFVNCEHCGAAVQPCVKGWLRADSWRQAAGRQEKARSKGCDRREPRRRHAGHGSSSSTRATSRKGRAAPCTWAIAAVYYCLHVSERRSPAVERG
jgi:hypothetical protein